MILPSKHLPQERALLTVGARILEELYEPITVSALWERLQSREVKLGHQCPTHYDSFVLALDLLFALHSVNITNGLIFRSHL